MAPFFCQQETRKRTCVDRSVKTGVAAFVLVSKAGEVHSPHFMPSDFTLGLVGEERSESSGAGLSPSLSL